MDDPKSLKEPQLYWERCNKEYRELPTIFKIYFIDYDIIVVPFPPLFPSTLQWELPTIYKAFTLEGMSFQPFSSSIGPASSNRGFLKLEQGEMVKWCNLLSMSKISVTKQEEERKIIFKSVATHIDSPVNLRGNKSQNKNMKSLCKENHLSFVISDNI